MDNHGTKKELIEQQERLDNQRREDLAIQYKPFFVIKESNVQFIGNEVLHIRIVFENIGRGEANDVEIDYNLQNNKDEYFTISQPSNKKIIPSNGNCFLGITLQHPAGISIDNNVMNIDPLPIELNKVFKFSACLNYRNPIINEKQYFLEFDFNIVYAVKRDQHQKITSFKQGKDNLDREWIVQITNENYK